MLRRRVKHTQSLETRLSEEVKSLREKEKMPPGPEQVSLLRKVRETEMVAQMTGWITSPGCSRPGRNEGSIAFVRPSSPAEAFVP